MDQPTGLNRERLATYLDLHLTGADGGLDAFKAAADTWRGTPQEPALESLVDQVRADHHDLEDLLGRLGHHRNAARRVLGAGARAVGRVNPANALRAREGGASQVELDLLIGAVNAKLSMWELLLLMEDRDPALDLALLEDLRQRAESQIAQLKGIRDATWAERFATDRGGAAAGDAAGGGA